MIRTAYLNLGSNIGDRLFNLESAVAAIEARIGAQVRRSPVIESEPWGFGSANAFANIGLAFPTSLPPAALLDLLLGIQSGIDPAPHRDASGAYIDRRIDIDLIAVDDLVISSPHLVLPHPRMHLREFVLRPMLCLAPGWRHPILGLTPAQMLSRL